MRCTLAPSSYAPIDSERRQSRCRTRLPAGRVIRTGYLTFDCQPSGILDGWAVLQRGRPRSGGVVMGLPTFGGNAEGMAPSSRLAEKKGERPAAVRSWNRYASPVNNEAAGWPAASEPLPDLLLTE